MKIIVIPKGEEFENLPPVYVSASLTEVNHDGKFDIVFEGATLQNIREDSFNIKIIGLESKVYSYRMADFISGSSKISIIFSFKSSDVVNLS